MLNMFFWKSEYLSCFNIWPGTWSMFNEKWCIGNNFKRCLNICHQVREKLEETGRLWWSNSDITVAHILYAEDHFSSRRQLFLFSLFATTLVLFFSSSPALTILKSSYLTGKPLVESSRSSTRSCNPPSVHVVCVSIPFLSLMNRNLITGLHLNTFHLISSCSGSLVSTFSAPRPGRAMDLPTGGR